MSETDQDVTARRGLDAQRRSRRCKLLQEKRRQVGYDGDDDHDDHDGFDDCMEEWSADEETRYRSGSADTTATEVAEQGCLVWVDLVSQVYVDQMRSNTAEGNNEEVVTDGPVAGAHDADIEPTGKCGSTANTAGHSQDHETDNKKTVGGEGGNGPNGSNGGDYVNAFKPINAGWVRSETSLRLFFTSMSILFF
ncbi:hypothetical protein LY76DRAFT_687644 [Colletotrichum caudatum]|nr:hypothetical protein LY76DRAFT_687644 [Colletotrichum caudatum]